MYVSKYVSLSGTPQAPTCFLLMPHLSRTKRSMSSQQLFIIDKKRFLKFHTSQDVCARKTRAEPLAYPPKCWVKIVHSTKVTIVAHELHPTLSNDTQAHLQSHASPSLGSLRQLVVTLGTWPQLCTMYFVHSATESSS